MEIFLTILKGIGIFALFFPFGMYMLVGFGGSDIGDLAHESKNSNWFIRIYMYYYPIVVGVALLVALFLLIFYVIGSEF